MKRTPIETALHFALKVHALEKDKGNSDYILHILRVAAVVSEDTQNDTEAVIVAILHDVVESESHAIDFIARTFSKEVFDAVNLLTRDKQIDYSVYIEKLKVNKLANIVKFADLRDNMLHWRKGRTQEQTKKYMDAIASWYV